MTYHESITAPRGVMEEHKLITGFFLSECPCVQKITCIVKFQSLYSNAEDHVAAAAIVRAEMVAVILCHYG